LKSLSGREMLKLLTEHGWRVIRIRGSHHNMNKEGSKVVLTVPVHGKKALKMGTQTTLLKQAGIKLP
jgi:predicted RNA binding protein YcfA (HicA-like mRNA interferase family)